VVVKGRHKTESLIGRYAGCCARIVRERELGCLDRPVKPASERVMRLNQRYLPTSVRADVYCYPLEACEGELQVDANKSVIE
jgi:hypothetical protein